MSESAGTVRVDLWLWSVRLCPSRSAATTAAKAGHVRINGRPAKPSASVKIGDEVRLTGARERKVVVRELLSKRVGAPLAVAAYDDQSPPPPPRTERPLPAFLRAPGSGRPTKRDRRVLDDFRRRAARDSTE